MKQVSMKEKGEAHGHGCCCNGPSVACDTPDYPYGLRIHLSEEQIAALGIQSLPAVGGPVGIEATGSVISTAEETDNGQPRRRIEIQITDLALAAAGTNKYAAMYADDPAMKD